MALAINDRSKAAHHLRPGSRRHRHPMAADFKARPRPPAGPSHCRRIWERRVRQRRVAGEESRVAAYSRCDGPKSPSTTSCTWRANSSHAVQISMYERHRHCLAQSRPSSPYAGGVRARSPPRGRLIPEAEVGDPSLHVCSARHGVCFRMEAKSGRGPMSTARIPQEKGKPLWPGRMDFEKV